MARALKWIFIVLAALLLLLVAAVIAVALLVDPNDYKAQIAQAVERQTGRQLAIEGDFELTFFPWLGLQLGQARLSDAPGFGEQPFAALDEARLAVAVWPLLSQRRLVLDKIVIDGLNLRLIRDAQGRGNWEDLAERFAREEDAPPAEPAPEPAGLPLAIESRGGLELRNATILWEDRQAGSRYLVQPLHVTVAELDPTRPLPVRAQWTLQAAEAPEVSGELTAQIVYDQAAQTVAVRDLALDARLRSEQIPTGALQAALRGEAQADLAQQRYRVPQLTLQAVGVTAELVAEARQQGELLSADLRLNVPAFDARELMRRLEIELPPMTDPNALTRVGLALAARYDGKELQIREMTGQLDQTRISGTAALPSFEPPVARFALALDRIDLDRYLAPKEADAADDAESVPGGAPAEASPAPEAELPLELLRDLVLDGTVTVGELVASGLRATDVETRITARNGILRAEPVAHFYQGRLRGLLTLDATGAAPRIEMQQRLEGVQAGSLLEDLIGVARILGVADLELAVAMQGMGLEQWLRTLSGKASFKFADGAINGINIAQAIQAARAKLANQPLPAADDQQTPFNELRGSVRIDEGLVVNRDFSLASSQFKVAGDGQLNLRTQALDYTLMVDLLQPLLESDNRLLAELQNQPIPVRISGSLKDLAVSVDLQQALEQAGKAKLKAAEEKAKSRLQEEVQERQQKLQEQVQDKLQNLLRPRR